MSINKMSAQSFPTPTIEEWAEKAEGALKGRKVDSLSKTTFENIKLKPLYTMADDNSPSQFPGHADTRRGSQTVGYFSQGWEVAQELTLQKDALHKAFSNGQTAISFQVGESDLSNLSLLEEFHSQYPYSLNGKKYHSLLIDKISHFSGEGKGYIGKDPLALLAELGAADDNVQKEYDELFETVEKAMKTLPNIRTLLVDTTPYHNGGANAVQELAIAISTGVTHIEELTKRGLTLETVLQKLVFQFSISSNFFMEMAKLRAARLLWNKITEAYGVKEESSGMVISARTSSFTKTIFDPYVNMLRAGNEAFSAVLGGVQYLHVSPFNEPEGEYTDFSTRIARNTQYILKEEAHLTKTIDPAGGSWYVEFLTNELAKMAWELFLEIEEKGGLLETLKNGWLQGEIASIRAKREKAIATRKQTIVGTNKYVDLQGKSLEAQTKMPKTKEGLIEAIPQVRIAESYEELRERAAKIGKPMMGLITLGSLKSFKARADFIQGFLAPGGIEGTKSGEINDVEEALLFVKETGFKHYCICGSNEQYDESAHEIVTKLMETYPNVQLYLAGVPEEKEKWKAAGIRDFLHVRSNCYETLASLLTEMEVGTDE